MKGFTTSGPRPEHRPASVVIAGTALLLGFLAYLLVQHWQVFPYNDDWGYATLTYISEQKGFHGQGFSQWQLVSFLHDEYLRWSGRFFPFFLQINLFKLGLDAVRLVQAFVILLIVCLSVKLTPVGRLRTPWLLVPMLYFMALPEFSVLGGLYWFSASIAYVWGIAVFMLALWRLRVAGRLDGVAGLLLGIAALFHEQMAVAMVAFAGGLALLALWDAERPRALVLPLALRCMPVLAGACLVILAPGNFARKAQSSYISDDMLTNVLTSARSLAHFLLDENGGHWVLGFMAVSLLVFAGQGMARAGWSGRARLAAWLGVPLVLGLAWLVSFLLFTLLLMTLYGVVLLLCRHQRDDGDLLVCTYLAALASLVLLLLAPVVAGRSLLIFYFLMMWPVTRAFVALADLPRGRTLVVLALLVAAPAALDNAADILAGYLANREANLANDAKLRAYHNDLYAGRNPGDSVVLEKLPAPRYAETMPYDRPLIETWMKKYYDIPLETRFVWENSGN
ncbi:DUF6056 family protein [Modicisalibacter coralii]|uniref:DUF6056 family protein n=1 Tax=Modicisalibacter coralii TaxID=2304602 RepID=UPI00100ADECD|nr:DUF6056 family protein [Halomonas coralii]